ncbi:MAG: hypothetical protein ACRDAM_16605 [Casimicrobium sp.]
MNRRLQAALAAESRGDRDAASTAYSAVLEVDAAHPGALYRCAQFAIASGERDKALTLFRDALTSARTRGLAKETLPIHSDRIVALREADARVRLNAVREAMADCGEVPGFLWEECECLLALNEKHLRLLRLNRLALLCSDDPVILAELGLALANSAPVAHQAIKPLRDAIALGFDSRKVRLALASIEIFQGELVPAELALRKLLMEDDTDVGALGKLWGIERSQCRWKEADIHEEQLLDAIEQGKCSRWLAPFALLDSRISPKALYDYSVRYASLGKTDTASAAKPAHTREVGARLRVGYISGDFHTHAVACHIVGLIEAHDRAAIETFAYSCGARVEQDAYRIRLKRAFEHWRDLNEMTDEVASQTIANDALDVLIDLSGPTHGNRSDVLARRPAPCVIHYLGYPGTVASGDVDYLLADPTVVPIGHESYYVEKILRMQHCYQVNDPRRERPPPPPRHEVGLPENAIVICNFNRPAKWTAPMMRIWLNALRAYPNAILWLASSDDTHSRDAVNTIATEFGVAKQVVWAPILQMSAHLARLGCADLALDQLPYSSHATGANALWMGVPLLTCLGEVFQGRVGASLANAAGLSDFVVTTLDDYEQKLHVLLSEPRHLSQAKQHLLTRATTLPLFDSTLFAREFEAKLRALIEARQ